jgi:hypothetical protein
MAHSAALRAPQSLAVRSADTTGALGAMEAR